VLSALLHDAEQRSESELGQQKIQQQESEDLNEKTGPNDIQGTSLPSDQM
jgi:hypothetical protein